MIKRPRLLLLSTYYYPFAGGVESHTRRLVMYLNREGCAVVVLTKRVDHHSPIVERIDEIPVYRVPPAGERTGLQKWIMIPCLIFAMLCLRRKFDLIYCPDFRGIGVAAIFAGKLLRRPVILGSHNLGILSCRNWDQSFARWHIAPEGFLANLLKWPIRSIYTAANAVTCVCHEMEEEALQCNIPPKRVHYLPNGVDVEHFQPPEPNERRRIKLEEGWPEGRLVCMYVGRLSVEKGILELLDAWRSIENERAILVVVGPDMPGHHMDAGQAARMFVAEQKMEDRVIFYGPSEDIARLLRGADIFIQPSHYEAFGISVIEAMATGLPVIATRVGGMIDYLVDGVNALLCEPVSSNDLARQIRRLLDDAALRDRLGREARPTVAREFAEVVIFKQFTRLFAETALGT